MAGTLPTSCARFHIAFEDHQTGEGSMSSLLLPRAVRQAVLHDPLQLPLPFGRTAPRGRGQLPRSLRHATRMVCTSERTERRKRSDSVCSVPCGENPFPVFLISTFPARAELRQPSAIRGAAESGTAGTAACATARNGGGDEKARAGSPGLKRCCGPASRTRCSGGRVTRFAGSCGRRAG